MIVRTKQEQQGEFTDTGVPICGGNFETPVVDNSTYVQEIHYKIGDRLYIENAD
jgi:hypothetical protein